MLSTLRHCLFAIAAATCVSCCFATTAAEADAASVKPFGDSPLPVTGIGRGTAPLDGLWQFHTGDDPAWAQPGFDDHTWQTLAVTRPWGAQSHPGYTGFAWYRCRLHIAPPNGDPAQSLAISMPRVEDAYDLYWNGEKIGQLGRLPPHARWYPAHPHTFGLPPHARDGVLAVRVWKAPLSSDDPTTLGGLEAPPLIGNATEIGRVAATFGYGFLKAHLVTHAVALILALALVLALIALAQDRTQRLYLWFAMFLLAGLIWCVPSFATLIYALSFAQAQTLVELRYALHDTALWLLLLWLFHLKDNRAIRHWTLVFIGINCTVLAVEIPVAFLWAHAGAGLKWMDGVLTVVNMVVELYAFVLVYHGLRRRQSLSAWLVAGAAILVGVYNLVGNLGGQGQRFTHFTLLQRMREPLLQFGGAQFFLPDALNTLLLIALFYAVLHHALLQRRHQAAMDLELKSAREVQQVLMPEALPNPPGFAIASVYRPAQQVGGDFFQIIPIGPLAGRFETLVVLGDVSGKGLRAAMTVSLLVGTLRTAARYTYGPRELLAVLNDRLLGRLGGGFVTCLALLLCADGSCLIANAGHLAPILNGAEMPLAGSLPLGIVSDAEYEQQSFTLAQGDRLTLYTDGVPESRNHEGVLYGFDRTAQLVAGASSAEHIAAAAQSFGQEDDITVITVTRVPAEQAHAGETISGSSILQVGNSV